MLEAAEKLEFERAAALRDKIQQLRSASGGGPARPAASPQGQSARSKAKAKARAGRRGKS
jgi:excinuclease ABC subunit B